MKSIPEGFVDLTVTSPPYDNLRDYMGFEFDFDTIAAELYRVTKPGGVVVWIVGGATHKGDESDTPFKQALGFRSAGFKRFDTIIYAKQAQGAVGNSKGYWQAFEYMFILTNGDIKTVNLIRDRKNTYRTTSNTTKRRKDGSVKKIGIVNYGEYGRRTNVWYYTTGFGHTTNDRYAYEHPAMFPEKLAEDHIMSWSNQGDLVFDPMCGSGTTLKMAMVHGRKYLGIEMSSDYVRIARKRLKSLQLTLEGY